jgi:hypothetical protein
MSIVKGSRVRYVGPGPVGLGTVRATDYWELEAQVDWDDSTRIEDSAGWWSFMVLEVVE